MDHVVSTAHNFNYFVRLLTLFFIGGYFPISFLYLFVLISASIVVKPGLLRPQCAALRMVPRYGLQKPFDRGFKKEVINRKRFGETAGLRTTLFAAHVNVILRYLNGMEKWITLCSQLMERDFLPQSRLVNLAFLRAGVRPAREASEADEVHQLC